MESQSRMSREQFLMETALLAGKRSTCSRAEVGVVLAREGRILVTGYNGAPAGLPHCDHSYQPPDDLRGCTTAVHAEANAIAYAARYGLPLHEADLFCSYTPCVPCAQLIITAGISAVYARTRYRDRGGEVLLSAAGIDIIFL